MYRDDISIAVGSQCPPHHEDCESAAVGSAMLDPTGEALRKMTAIITPNDLFRHVDRIVFTACLEVANAYGVVDIALLHDYLVESGQLAEIDGPLTLLKYQEAVPNTAHAEYYARVTLKNSIRRQVIDESRELIDAAQAQRESLTSLRNRVQALGELLDKKMLGLRPQDCDHGGQT